VRQVNGAKAGTEPLTGTTGVVVYPQFAEQARIQARNLRDRSAERRLASRPSSETLAGDRMTKRVVLLVLFALAISVPVADATTIEITEGRVYTDQFTLGDVCVTIPSPAINACSLGGGINSPQLYIPRVLIDGVSYDGPENNVPLGMRRNNLIMRFTYQPIPPQTPSFTVPYFVPEPVSTPFTMTGTLALLDPATTGQIVFDLIGAGSFTCCYRPDTLSGFPLTHSEFNFTSVPEPSSALLLAVPIVLLLMNKRWGDALLEDLRSE
jgi:hypothetical protein